MTRPPFRLIVSTLWVVLAGLSCIQNDGERWTPLQQFKLMSLDDERVLGMDFDRELNQHFKVIHDPIVTEFVQDLGLQIVAGVSPKEFIYRFRVIEAPQLNAFAVPGGYIYFHTGTLMAVTSVDELAMVMAHEVTHVSKRHLAHRRQDRKLPKLLSNAAMIAASVAVQDVTPLIAGMAINVAIDLRYSRTDESESDRLGGVYASRAGFDPLRGQDFFERVLAARPLYADGIPPYLFSHPAGEERIDQIRARSKSLGSVGEPTPGTRVRFRAMQARLAELLDRNLASLPGPGVASDHSQNNAAIEEINRLTALGENDLALQKLTTLAVVDPLDPRIPFHIGERLAEEGRLAGAISAYRKTIELDPSRALVYFRLGEAYRIRGERERAVYAYEQGLLLVSSATPLAQQARWEVVKLTFGVIADAGFRSDNGETVTNYPSDAKRMVWQGRVTGPLLEERGALSVRWRAPSGRIVSEGRFEDVGRTHVRAQLEAEALPDSTDTETASPPDSDLESWTLEVVLEEEVVHRDEAYWNRE